MIISAPKLTDCLEMRRLILRIKWTQVNVYTWPDDQCCCLMRDGVIMSNLFITRVYLMTSYTHTSCCRTSVCPQMRLRLPHFKQLRPGIASDSPQIHGFMISYLWLVAVVTRQSVDCVFSLKLKCKSQNADFPQRVSKPPERWRTGEFKTGFSICLRHVRPSQGLTHGNARYRRIFSAQTAAEGIIPVSAVCFVQIPNPFFSFWVELRQSSRGHCISVRTTAGYTPSL